MPLLKDVIPESVELHAMEGDSPIKEVMQTIAHVALKVEHALLRTSNTLELVFFFFFPETKLNTYHSRKLFE